MKPIKVTRGLFFLNALIWVGVGVYTYFQMTGRYSGQTVMIVIVSGLMLGNALAMLASGLLIARQKKIYYFFAWAVILVNILLTFTDQFGLYDFLTLVLDLVIAGFLFIIRRDYFTHETNL